MCGICGYVGKMSKQQFHNMLCSNETRGGHAWGAAWKESNQIMYYKEPGRYAISKFKLDETDLMIAHTRWATNGKPEQNENNHPHVGGGICLVHNGVVSNKHPKQKTECDSEAILKMIISHDISGYYKIIKAIKKTCEKIKGSFRIAVVSTKFPDRIFIACDEADPVYFGYGKDWIAFSSEEKDLPKRCTTTQAIGGRIYVIKTDMTMEMFKFKIPSFASKWEYDWRKSNYHAPYATYRHFGDDFDFPRQKEDDENECEQCLNVDCNSCDIFKRLFTDG